MSRVTQEFSTDFQKASDIYYALRAVRPGTEQDMRNYIKVFFGVGVPSSDTGWCKNAEMLVYRPFVPTDINVK